MQAALSSQFNRDRPPSAVKAIPIDDILGPEGHAAVNGYELVGDSMKDAADQRRNWMRAVRTEMDGGSSFEEAFETVRSTAADNDLTEPAIQPIESFVGGTFSVQFIVNRTGDGYDVMSFHVSPRRGDL